MTNHSTDRPRVWLSWSSGKDSAFTLHALRQAECWEVAGLVTTVNQTVGRVSIHAVRRELLAAQAATVGLPVHVVYLPEPCSNDIYRRHMQDAAADLAAAGATHIAFGDLFLADVRAYREELFADTQLQPLFPLWGRDTTTLARRMLAEGLKAIVAAVDPARLPETLAGSGFDEAFISALPPGVDPCGERGEFHTFVTDAPGFRHPIRAEVGRRVRRGGMAYVDIALDAGEPRRASR